MLFGMRLVGWSKNARGLGSGISFVLQPGSRKTVLFEFICSVHMMIELLRVVTSLWCGYTFLLEQRYYARIQDDLQCCESTLKSRRNFDSALKQNRCQFINAPHNHKLVPTRTRQCQLCLPQKISRHMGQERT